MASGYFTSGLAGQDEAVFAALENEFRRQQEVIELIASENFVSRAVLEAQGSVLTNKTVEGYPGACYHGGAHAVDQVERLAIERACKLFGCRFANVQPHSGSHANQAVLKAILKPGDTMLAMDLKSGGHLSHGAPANVSGQIYRAVHYGVREQDGRIDYDQIERLAWEHGPKLIIAGGSSYPLALDLDRLRDISKLTNAKLLVDMAHFAGLVVGNVLANPVHSADVVTTTTYKSMRGARGGIILTNDPELAGRINAAVFPGVQGSVMLHSVAGKAVSLGEALLPEFAEYARQVHENAQTLADTLMDCGMKLVGGGTETPLMLLDLRPFGLKGNAVSDVLDEAGITCNKNVVPGDLEPPSVTSGPRFGASAVTTRGFRTPEMKLTGEWIAQVLQAMKLDPAEQKRVIQRVRSETRHLALQFPIYQECFYGNNKTAAQ